MGKLRALLLEQHKLLLDRERTRYEEANGPIGGPMPFLGLVMGDPHFAWLKTISTVIVEIDGAMSRLTPADQAGAEAIIEQTRQILTLREAGDEFQTRYYAAVQESPDVVILQCRIEQLLGI